MSQKGEVLSASPIFQEVWRMRFFADSAYCIGHKHYNEGLACQDYAMAQSFDKAAIVAVSDGCSTGNLTDFGSRILTLSALKILRRKWLQDVSFAGVDSEIILAQDVIIESTTSLLSLSIRDLLATMLYACLSENGGELRVFGDGAIAFKYKDGNIKLYLLDWENNVPYYPAYRLSNLDGFIDEHQGLLSLTQQKILIDPDGQVSSMGNSSYSLKQGISGVSYSVDQEELAELEYVALFSDGVAQVDAYSASQVVYELMKFKSLAGKFVTRRFIRHVKEAKKNGLGPIDDIACAVIRIQQE
jgi:hypothetical protein